MDLLEKLNKKKPGVKGVLNSHLDQIKNALQKGYKKKEIYVSFKEEGLIEGDYTYFIRTLNTLLNSTQNNKILKARSNSQQPKKQFKIEDIDYDDLDG